MTDHPMREDGRARPDIAEVRTEGRARPSDQAGQASPGAAKASPPFGDHPSRGEVGDWLVANCGRGLPYVDGTDLPTALHGVAYVLRQIEGTASYKVNIGQCGPAASSLRWMLEYVARHEMSRDRDASLAEEAKRLSGEAVAARAEGIAPQVSGKEA